MADDPNKKKADGKKVSRQPHKRDMNAGSGAFNQGAEQDPDYDKGTKVSDEEKLTGRSDDKGKAREDGGGSESYSKRKGDIAGRDE